MKLKTRTYEVHINWHDVDTHAGQEPPDALGGWKLGTTTTITDDDFGGQSSGLTSRTHRIVGKLDYTRRDIEELTIRALIGAAMARLCRLSDKEDLTNAQTHLLWHLSDAAAWVKEAVHCDSNDDEPTGETA